MEIKKSYHFENQNLQWLRSGNLQYPAWRLVTHENMDGELATLTNATPTKNWSMIVWVGSPLFGTPCYQAYAAINNVESEEELLASAMEIYKSLIRALIGELQ